MCRNRKASRSSPHVPAVAVEDGFQPALPGGGAPAQVLREQLVTVAVHHGEKPGNSVFAAAAVAEGGIGHDEVDQGLLGEVAPLGVFSDQLPNGWGACSGVTHDLLDRGGARGNRLALPLREAQRPWAHRDDCASGNPRLPLSARPRATAKAGRSRAGRHTAVRVRELPRMTLIPPGAAEGCSTKIASASFAAAGGGRSLLEARIGASLENGRSAERRKYEV